jgi:hypothetical protein
MTTTPHTKQAARDDAIVRQRECDEWMSKNMPHQWAAFIGGGRIASALRDLLQSTWLGAWQKYAGDSWQPIDTAPKSTSEGGRIKAIYLLGFCPDEAISREACIDAIWWEPLTKGNDGKMGCWYGSGAMEVRPTHWQPLPQPPKDIGHE